MQIDASRGRTDAEKPVCYVSVCEVEGRIKTIHKLGRIEENKSCHPSDHKAGYF